MSVSLRPVSVEAGDLERFYDQQSDRGAADMAAVPVRSRGAHFAHWHSSLSDPSVIPRTVELDGRVAGLVVSWRDGNRRLVGYRLGRAFWGRGVASAALGLFIEEVAERPLYAYVAEHNAGSIRVLEKNGFVLAEVQPVAQPGDVEERLYLLR